MTVSAGTSSRTCHSDGHGHSGGICLSTVYPSAIYLRPVCLSFVLLMHTTPNPSSPPPRPPHPRPLSPHSPHHPSPPHLRDIFLRDTYTQIYARRGMRDHKGETSEETVVCVYACRRSAVITYKITPACACTKNKQRLSFYIQNNQNSK